MVAGDLYPAEFGLRKGGVPVLRSEVGTLRLGQKVLTPEEVSLWVVQWILRWVRGARS